VSESFTIARRFCGPEGSGNGGYTCGMVAGFLDGDAEVTLRRPPPLERALAITREGERVLVRDGDDLIAEGRPATIDLEVPEPPTMEQAEAASRRYPGLVCHAFPTCFVCGTGRPPGDGLRLFTGPVEGRPGLVASPVRTDPTLPSKDGALAPEIAWAVLDCPGAWAVERHVEGHPVVLGRMAARLLAPFPAGDTGLVVGWARGREGRKLFSGTACFTSEGELLGFADQTWVVLA
jgi:hypothetical protein